MIGKTAKRMELGSTSGLMAQNIRALGNTTNSLAMGYSPPKLGTKTFVIKILMPSKLTTQQTMILRIKMINFLESKKTRRMV